LSDAGLGPAFPITEYEARLASVREGMRRRNLAALVLFSPENLFYLLGYESIGNSSFQLAVIPESSEPRLLVRELEQSGAAQTSWIDSVPVTVSDGQDPVEAAVELLKALRLDRERVGFERTAPFLTAGAFMSIQSRLGGAALADGSGIVEAARRIKSPAEILAIRKAARYTQAGMQAAIDALHAGARDNDLAAAAAEAIYRAGSEYMCSAPIVTTGARSGTAHTTFARRVISEGDAVLLEMGGVHQRYTGPLMRSAVVGEPSRLIADMYRVCDNALSASIGMMRPGVTAGSVHATCQAVIDDAGYGPNFRKRLGYSVGVGFPPDWGEGDILHLSSKDPTPLAAGMVFHLPPALRREGIAGVGCSETVLVTGDGAEPLTHFPRQLAVR
jgi:Xaa-Pro dipeptidase